ncbi:MAG: helix-turn-helix domain-containing protein [Planctomycetes bacterium]|nr:helix-turn-helix domain-containing protein [Planctomycetota bacterium]
MNSRQFYRRASDSPIPLALSARQAADALGVSVSTIERLTRSGELPSVKLGSCRRYRVEAIEALLRSRETAVGGDA